MSGNATLPTISDIKKWVFEVYKAVNSHNGLIKTEPYDKELENEINNTIIECFKNKGHYEQLISFAAQQLKLPKEMLLVYGKGEEFERVCILELHLLKNGEVFVKHWDFSAMI